MSFGIDNESGARLIIMCLQKLIRRDVCIKPRSSTVPYILETVEHSDMVVRSTLLRHVADATTSTRTAVRSVLLVARVTYLLDVKVKPACRDDKLVDEIRRIIDDWRVVEDSNVPHSQPTGTRYTIPAVIQLL